MSEFRALTEGLDEMRRAGIGFASPWPRRLAAIAAALLLLSLGAAVLL